MKPKTFTPAKVMMFGLVLAGGLLLCPLALTQEANEPPKEPQFVESYKQTWEAVKGQINVASIEKLAANLGSANQDVRQEAIANLQRLVGLNFGFDASAEVAKREQAYKRWQRYAASIKTAVEEKVPAILKPHTSQNKKNSCALALQFLGEEAPHPAFLPLLHAVLANGEEDKYTRVRALRAISQIPHEGVVEFLIEQLDTDLARSAWQQLEFLTGAGIISEKGWADIKKRYEAWWAENKEKFQYDRERTLFQ